MKCDNFLASSLPKNSDKSEGGKTWRDVWKAILIQSSRLVYYNVNVKEYLFNNKRYSPKKQCRHYFPTAIFFLYKEEHPLNNKRYSQKKQCRYYFDIKVWQLLSHSHIFSVQKRRKIHPKDYLWHNGQKTKQQIFKKSSSSLYIKNDILCHS